MIVWILVHQLRMLDDWLLSKLFGSVSATFSVSHSRQHEIPTYYLTICGEVIALLLNTKS